MARNPNEALKNNHTVYCGSSGSGKTTAIHKLGLIPKSARVAIYDPYNTYHKLSGRNVIKCYALRDFYLKLASLMNDKRRKGFVISLVGVYGVTELIVFSKMIWSVADGGKVLHVVIEELIQSVVNSSKLDKAVKELWQGGRKYGLVMHALFQRSQEVPKSIVNGSAVKWVGKQDSMRDARYWSDEIDYHAQDIKALQDLEYFLKNSTGTVVRGKLPEYKATMSA